MINVAILGFGVVGSGTAEVLTQNKAIIEKRVGQPVNIKYILDLRDFPDSPFADLVIHDFNVIANDPEVSVVAEMMGGSHPAYDFTLACLKAGKSVVTSNKEVVANFGTELLALAKENGVSYLFEASVGGGIPLTQLARDTGLDLPRRVEPVSAWFERILKRHPRVGDSIVFRNAEFYVRKIRRYQVWEFNLKRHNIDDDEKVNDEVISK